MNYQLTVTPKPGYLHAVVTGPNTKENVDGYLQDLMHQCLAQSCGTVLIEERLEGPRLRTLEVFDIAAMGSHRAHGKFKAIAYVDVNAENTMNVWFGENVATNRGLPIAVFMQVAAAEAWLLQKIADGGEPRPGSGVPLARLN